MNLAFVGNISTSLIKFEFDHDTLKKYIAGFDFVKDLLNYAHEGSWPVEEFLFFFPLDSVW